MTKRPSKPTKAFPLWPHKSGSWCAVIDNQRKSFGGWRTDPKGVEALGRYSAFMETRRTGISTPLVDATITLKQVIDRYLSRELRRATAKEIGQRDFRNAQIALADFAGSVGRFTRVANLRPARFAQYRAVMMDREMAPSSMKRNIAHIKRMFRWAFDQEIIAAPPRLGQDFKPAKAQRPRKLLFSPDEIVKLLDAADVTARAMVRLGIECGFGNTDVAVLRWDEMNLDTRIIELNRHKTKIERRCVISPELVEDLKGWQAIRDRRIAKGDVPILEPELVFSTLRGLRYVREIPGESPTDPPRVVDSVAVAFDKLARNKAKIKHVDDGRGFYTLRRTHRTWTDELRDPHAAALVMGHSFGSVAGLYVQHVGDERLIAINRHVCDRIKQTRKRLESEARRGAGVGRASGTASPANHAKPRKPRGRGGRFAKSGARGRRKH